MTTIKSIGALDEKLDGSKLKIGIVYARWNSTVIDGLVEGAIRKLKEFGVREENIGLETVPGSYELPTGVRVLSSSGNYDALIAVGTLIKGDTAHFEYICGAVSSELMKMQADIQRPVIFGVLTCLTEEQALLRAGLTQGGHNHGEDWGAAAVEMAVKTHRAGGAAKVFARN